MIYLPLMKTSVWEGLQLWQRKELSICVASVARRKLDLYPWASLSRESARGRGMGNHIRGR